MRNFEPTLIHSDHSDPFTPSSIHPSIHSHSFIAWVASAQIHAILIRYRVKIPLPHANNIKLNCLQRQFIGHSAKPKANTPTENREARQFIVLISLCVCVAFIHWQRDAFSISLSLSHSPSQRLSAETPIIIMFIHNNIVDVDKYKKLMRNNKAIWQFNASWRLHSDVSQWHCLTWHGMATVGESFSRI